MRNLVLLLTVFAVESMADAQIYVEYSDSWPSASRNGGARPQNVEIMKTISKRKECAGMTVTLRKETAVRLSTAGSMASIASVALVRIEELEISQ